MIRSKRSSLASLKILMSSWTICVKDAIDILLSILRFSYMSKIVIISLIVCVKQDASWPQKLQNIKRYYSKHLREIRSLENSSYTNSIAYLLYA